MTLVNEMLEAGVFSVTLSASGLPSGVYLYRIQAGGFDSTKRLTVLK
jgi:hypothetical protein